MPTIYQSDNITVFDNEILEEKLENQLTTSLNLSNYITVDNSLASTPGMKIEIHTYHGTGDVEDLDMGDGNTGDIGAYYTTEAYRVSTTQGRVPYYDEQQMADPMAIDKAIKHLSEQMTNDLTKKIVGELDKASNVVYEVQWGFAAVVNAIASMPSENNEGLFMLINRKDAAAFQIAMEDHLKYVEDNVRTGYIGSVAGVPVVMTDAVQQGNAYIATREAVTAFVKKGSEIEQERNANERQTIIYGRKVMVVALTNDDKVVKLTTGSEPEHP